MFIGIVVVLAVVAFGVWAFSGVTRLRGPGTGQQSADSWYQRYADRKRRQR